jgi:hypothetical protein
MTIELFEKQKMKKKRKENKTATPFCPHVK